MSNNLEGPRVADNQTSGQNRTANEALDVLDAAITSSKVLVVTDSNSVEPSIGYIYGNFRFVLTPDEESPPTGKFTVELTAFTKPRGPIFFINETGEAAELYCAGQSAPHVIIVPGGSGLVDFDKNTVREITNRDLFMQTIAVSDETSVLTTGTGVVTFRMPCSVYLTEVRASLNVPQSGGTELTVDINQEGSSILSTKLTIDNAVKTSKDASTPAVISDSYLSDDAEISIDIDDVGSGSPAGLKVTLIGYRY